ncbi:MAG: cysteine desulfurase family protein [Longimicrobiales bacterium]
MTGIYLDHAATTPLRPEAAEAMAPYLADCFGNPNSPHRWGREARVALEQARQRVASALGAAREEIYFTGCGTEADNIAVVGRARALRTRPGGVGGVVCSAIEHKAVLAAADAVAAEGGDVTLLAVDETGHVDPSALDEVIDAHPAVVSVMWVNNEIGVVQPIPVLAERCKAAGVAFHTDAVQAFGKLRVRVDETAVDMLALSGHKIGAPKGVGVLYLRRGVEVSPICHGGGQEAGLRPGTQNVAAAVAMSVAVELGATEQAAEAIRLAALRDRLEQGLCGALPDAVVNGGGERAPHVLNLSLPGLDQEAALIALDMEGIAASGGSACQSGGVEPSHVLVAIGRPAEGEAWIRFSFGRTTTAQEIDEAVARVPRIVDRIRSLSAV